VLNRDVKQFGKSFLTDNKEETCWNSDQGSPQFIVVDFPNEVYPEELLLKFQGGFVGQKCTLEAATESKGEGSTTWENLLTFYPMDVNSLQKFSVPCDQAVKRLKITFESSTDFFGRIIVYRLDVLGRNAL